MQDDKEPLVSFAGVGFGYKGKEVFENLSFALPSSVKTCALTGPDGAGKSTLLKLCAGLETPSAGRITSPRRGVSYMSQSLGLYLELRVWENLTIAAGLNGADLNDQKQVAYLKELLERCDLLRFKDTKAGALSGGMKQKLALCIALSPRPDFLLLDEPTVGVDPLSRQELWQLIESYLEERKARCLFSTAYLEEAERCDLILMLDEHGNLETAVPRDCLESMRGHVFVLKTKDGLNPADALTGDDKKRLILKLQESPLLHDANPRDGGIFLTAKERWDPGALQEALSPDVQGHLFSLQERRPRLEDYCMARSARNLKPGLAALQGPLQLLKEEPVQTAGLERRFGAFIAVNKTSFAVKRAEIFGLLGPNGAGKTTTFRMLCALLRTTGGKIFINGLELRKQKSQARAQIGYVSQKFSLYGRLSVKDNLLYFGRSYGLKGEELEDRIASLTRDFELEEVLEREASAISFGQQRSLSMCCALLHRPSILFLDEATSGADPASRRIFWRRINALSLAGTTVIVTTHFMEEAEYCDRFLIQDQGTMLFCGTAEEFCRDAQGEDLIEQGFIKAVKQGRQERLRGQESGS